MSDTRKCNRCGEVKPLDDFPLRSGAYRGHGYHCKPCHAEQARERRKYIPASDKAEAQKAFRAGVRKDKCAICRTAIEGHGICDQCAEAVEMLGGLEGLKQAVRAVRYLGE